jgi:hypothetical protein
LAISYSVSKNRICIAALLSRKSAASLINFALSTSALAEITLASAILLFLAAVAKSDYISGVSTISLMNTSSIKIPLYIKHFQIITPAISLLIKVLFYTISNFISTFQYFL